MPWRRWIEHAKTPEEVTARDVGQTWASLVHTVREIRRVVRPLRWIILVLVVLVVATQFQANSAKNAANRARDASNAAKGASVKAETASRDAERASRDAIIQSQLTQKTLEDAIAAVTASQSNQGTLNARAQLDQLYDLCVVRKEC